MGEPISRLGLGVENTLIVDQADGRALSSDRNFPIPGRGPGSRLGFGSIRKACEIDGEEDKGGRPRRESYAHFFPR